MLIGYARVSTKEQSLDLQLDALKAAGCERIYQEKQSGKSAKDRPELQRLLDTLREGDTLVVYKLDRLGRSTRDLIDIVGQLDSAGVAFKSVTEQIDTAGAMGRLIFHVFASLAEFERSIISDRTKAGLEAAKARGRLGGRRYALSESKRDKVVRLHAANTHSNREIADLFGVSERTVGNIVRAAKEAREAVASGKEKENVS